jgi:hypothetical protein
MIADWPKIEVRNSKFEIRKSVVKFRVSNFES